GEADAPSMCSPPAGGKGTRTGNLGSCDRNSQSYGDGRDRRSNEQPGYRSGRGVYGSGSHGVRGTFVTGKPAGRNDNDTDWGKRDFEASGDRKSTRLNSSHVSISYAVFCLQ